MTFLESSLVATAEPLVSSAPRAGCRATVIIPARNEEHTLPLTLDALWVQRGVDNGWLDRNSYEVILLLNNCTDASYSVATDYQHAHPEFALHVVSRALDAEHAFVGVARRMLMDAAYERLSGCKKRVTAILSTDADSVVAPDWIVRNLKALEAGADVVGGVIHFFPEDIRKLAEEYPAIYLAYQRDRELRRLTARLESILDPDPSDPWPRHLEHFGGSLACTPSIYAAAGGLPPVQHLEDMAFIDALRRIGARIRHCPDTHVFTSARFNGRAQVGLSGQLRHWQEDAERNLPHMVDSADWLEHRFRSIAALRSISESTMLPSLRNYSEVWRERIQKLHAEHLPTSRFLERLDSDALINEDFRSLHLPRRAEITVVLRRLSETIEDIDAFASAT